VGDVSFELREHTADVAVAARGGTLGEAFAAVADGLAAAMCDEIPPTGGERYEVEVRAEGRESLLFDYLDEVIYRRDVAAVLPVDHEAHVEEVGGEWHLTGSFRGVPFADVVARDVKAVTYSEMRVERDGEEWTAYVVLDV
jgi:SHS2 domain-containing protein